MWVRVSVRESVRECECERVRVSVDESECE